MDTAALVATLTSMMAIGLTLVTARLLRQERQRSDARVTMLASLSAQPAFDPIARTAPIDAPPLRLEPRTRPRQAAHTAPPPRVPRPIEATAADVEIFRAAAPASIDAPAPALFGPAPARTGISLVYIFACAVIVAGMIALGFRWALPSSPSPTLETTATVGAPAPAASAQPLALVSLRHEQHPDGTLLISGVVRNPPGAAPRERLFAAASLLDGEGALIATARAPLDFTSLASGDESPFVVRVTGATGVARYRVGFRDASGASIAHEDKR